MLWKILGVALVLFLLWRCIRVASKLPDTTPADEAEEEYRQAVIGYKQAGIAYQQCESEYTNAAIYDWCAASERLKVALAKVRR